MRINGRGPKDSMFAGCFSFEESCTGRFGNPEISAASGERITLGAICLVLKTRCWSRREIKEASWASLSVSKCSDGGDGDGGGGGDGGTRNIYRDSGRNALYPCGATTHGSERHRADVWENEKRAGFLPRALPSPPTRFSRANAETAGRR